MELLVGVHDEIAVIFVLVSSSKVIPGIQRLKNYHLGSKLPVHERPTLVSVKE